jgi:4'-phosphopantetheinyl transferase
VSGATVDIWVARASAAPAQLDEWLDELDRPERARFEQLRQELDRRRFVVGHRLVRRVLAARLGTEPRAVPLIVDCPTCGLPHGRPRLPGSGLGAPVSISHAGDLVLVAHTPAALGPVSVGVDVELVSGTEWDGFDTAALTPSERAAVAVSPRPGARSLLWTRKEAILKALGVGLRWELSAIDLAESVSDDHGHVTVDVPLGLAAHGGPTQVVWRSLPAPSPGYALAVARTVPSGSDEGERDVMALTLDGEALLG